MQEKAQRTNLKTTFIAFIIYAIISRNIEAMKLSMVTCVETYEMVAVIDVLTYTRQ